MKYIHEREIWLVDLEPTKGIEMQKVRPCLVERVFNQQHLIIIPLSSQIKNNELFYCLEDISFLEHTSWVCCSQIRSIDRSRCKKLLGKIPDSKFFEIKKILGKVLKLSPQGPNGQNESTRDSMNPEKILGS